MSITIERLPIFAKQVRQSVPTLLGCITKSPTVALALNPASPRNSSQEAALHSHGPAHATHSCICNADQDPGR